MKGSRRVVSDFSARLIELAWELPGPFPPHDPLDAVVVHRGVARTSGCLPRTPAGVLAFTGRVGDEVSLADAITCARLCALNAVSLLQDSLGSLNRIERVLSVIGFVACTPDFNQQPAVIDGASHALVELFGEAGRHSRSALGVTALPRGGPVEIEVAVAVSDA